MFQSDPEACTHTVDLVHSALHTKGETGRLGSEGHLDFVKNVHVKMQSFKNKKIGFYIRPETMELLHVEFCVLYDMGTLPVIVQDIVCHALFAKKIEIKPNEFADWIRENPRFHDRKLYTYGDNKILEDHGGGGGGREGRRAYVGDYDEQWSRPCLHAYFEWCRFVHQLLDMTIFLGGDGSQDRNITTGGSRRPTCLTFLELLDENDMIIFD